MLMCKEKRMSWQGLWKKWGPLRVVRETTKERSKRASDHGMLPEGFEDPMARNGSVIKGWAPQVAILRQRAMEALVTHCGWNSVLEGLSVGVVMLTWPMGADQFTNAQLLVD